MEHTQLFLTGGNLFVLVFTGVCGLVAWMGTLTWKLSGTLSSLGEQSKQSRDAISELKESLGEQENRLRSDFSEHRAEVRGDFRELRADLTDLRRELGNTNARLTRAEGPVGLVAFKPKN